MLNFNGFRTFEKLPEKLFIYTGLFLGEDSRANLLRMFNPVHPNIFADHITLCFKPDLVQVRRVETAGDDTGRIGIRVTGYAQDEKAQAISIELHPRMVELLKSHGVEMKNKILHITISCAEGVSPAYSNELVERVLPTKGMDWIFYTYIGFCAHTDRNHLPEHMWKRRGL